VKLIEDFGEVVVSPTATFVGTLGADRVAPPATKCEPRHICGASVDIHAGLITKKIDQLESVPRSRL
jgi:hypothetical protein